LNEIYCAKNYNEGLILAARGEGDHIDVQNLQYNVSRCDFYINTIMYSIEKTLHEVEPQMLNVNEEYNKEIIEKVSNNLKKNKNIPDFI
jgi:hypothetical protein